MRASESDPAKLSPTPSSQALWLGQQAWSLTWGRTEAKALRTPSLAWQKPPKRQRTAPAYRSPSWDASHRSLPYCSRQAPARVRSLEAASRSSPPWWKRSGRTQSSQRPFETGLCLDTAHMFAAGYPLHEAEGLDSLMEESSSRGLLSRTGLMHLNDSSAPFASNRDRHENPGDGQIGYEGLARVVRHPALAQIPFVLETPGARATDPMPPTWPWSSQCGRGLQAYQESLLPAHDVKKSQGHRTGLGRCPPPGRRSSPPGRYPWWWRH